MHLTSNTQLSGVRCYKREPLTGLHLVPEELLNAELSNEMRERLTVLAEVKLWEAADERLHGDAGARPPARHEPSSGTPPPSCRVKLHLRCPEIRQSGRRRSLCPTAASCLSACDVWQHPPAATAAYPTCGDRPAAPDWSRTSKPCRLKQQCEQ